MFEEDNFDEGVGFDLAELEGRMANSKAFGLFGVRERLELLGGRLEVLLRTRGSP